MAEPSLATYQAALDRRFAEDVIWARWAIARWVAFPIEREPRPLVLVGERAFVEHGFTTGEAKLAYLERRIEAATALPDQVIDALTAEREVRSSGRGGRPLVITHALLDETNFVTDRGPRLLPAWRLTAIDALGPIWILDPDLEPGEWRPVEPPAITPPALQAPRSDPGAYVQVGTDSGTLTLHFMGALPQYERYSEAEIIESPHAFAIVPRAEDIGPPGARILPGYGHEITVRLASPIGPRVLVNLHGQPLQVLQHHDAG